MTGMEIRSLGMIPVGNGLVVLTMKTMEFLPVMSTVMTSIETSVLLQMKLAAFVVAGI